MGFVQKCTPANQLSPDEELDRIMVDRALCIFHIVMTASRGFRYLVASKLVPEMTYVWADADPFIIDHVEVGEELKGNWRESN
jgi:hypothetical protein